MKKKVICLSAIVCSFVLHAQLNLFTNVAVLTDDSVVAESIFPSGPAADTSMTDLPCSPAIFYSVDNNGTIRYHQLGTSSITTLGTLMTRPFCFSLAVSNNFSGGSPDPTFYQDTMLGSGVHEHRYYDASGAWNAVSPLAPSNMRLSNCGGYGPYCYFMSYQMVAAISQKIYRYDGISWQLIYDCTSSGRNIIVADLGVDQNGNLIIVENYPSAGYMSDSLYVISPTGQILAQHPFQLDMSNMYGAMVINSVYYVGFGNANPVYPDQIVPFYITTSGVITGSPYTFPSATTYYDLAGCEPGVMTGFNSSASHVSDFSVWPVPAVEKIHFESHAAGVWNIFTADGRLVMNGETNGAATIDIHALPAGIYVLVIVNADAEVHRTRFVIE